MQRDAIRQRYDAQMASEFLNPYSIAHAAVFGLDLAPYRIP
jgi:hypothetical protein